MGNLGKTSRNLSKIAYIDYKTKKISAGRDYVGYDEWKNKVLPADVGTEVAAAGAPGVV